MAKQVGPLFFTGTVDGLIFYKLGDQYYMRSKGDYKSGKQMRKDPTYRRTMQQADRFGEASNLLKKVYYRHLPKAVRKHGLYGKLTGMINTWLYQGKSKEEVRELLLAHCQELAASVTPAAPAATEAKPVEPKVADGKLAVAAQAVATPPATLTAPPQPTVKTPHTPRMKQARYLSKWKVKRNGRLQIPQSTTIDRRSSAAIHAPSANPVLDANQAYCT